MLDGRPVGCVRLPVQLAGLHQSASRDSRGEHRGGRAVTGGAKSFLRIMAVW